MSLKEIAHRAGTSVSTVSRVLNQPNYKCKNPELEARIWAAAQEISYTPNTAAQTLKSGAPQIKTTPLTFDIFLTRFPSLSQDLFFSELFESLKKELLRQQCVPGKFLTLPEVTSMLKEKSSFSVTDTHADGIILLGKCPAELISTLQNHYHNIVGIDRNPTNFDYDEVICSGTTAAVTAMNYLISLGHKKIAYIGDCTYESRYIGYYQALLNHRIPLDYNFVYPSTQTESEGFQIMNRILTSNNRPTAVFCANDCTAIGVLKSIKMSKKRGYHPSVISIDNIRESEHTSPLLTTINIPKKQMAHLALMLLLDQRKGEHKECVRIELPSRLIKRDSCSYSPY